MRDSTSRQELVVEPSVEISGYPLGGPIGGWALTRAGFSAAAVSAWEPVSDAVAHIHVLWGVGGIVDESGTDPVAAAEHRKEGKDPEG